MSVSFFFISGDLNSFADSKFLQPAPQNEFYISGPGGLDDQGFPETRPFEVETSIIQSPVHTVCMYDGSLKETLASLSVYKFSCGRPSSSPLFSSFPMGIKKLADDHRGKSRIIMSIGDMKVRDGDTNGENNTMMLMAILGHFALSLRWNMVFVAIHPRQIDFYQKLGFKNIDNGPGIGCIGEDCNLLAVLMSLDQDGLNQFPKTPVGRLFEKLQKTGTSILKAVRFVPKNDHHIARIAKIP